MLNTILELSMPILVSLEAAVQFIILWIIYSMLNRNDLFHNSYEKKSYRNVKFLAIIPGVFVFYLVRVIFAFQGVHIESGQFLGLKISVITIIITLLKQKLETKISDENKQKIWKSYRTKMWLIFVGGWSISLISTINNYATREFIGIITVETLFSLGFCILIVILVQSFQQHKARINTKDFSVLILLSLIPSFIFVFFINILLVLNGIILAAGIPFALSGTSGFLLLNQLIQKGKWKENSQLEQQVNEQYKVRIFGMISIIWLWTISSIIFQILDYEVSLSVKLVFLWYALLVLTINFLIKFFNSFAPEKWRIDKIVVAKSLEFSSFWFSVLFLGFNLIFGAFGGLVFPNPIILPLNYYWTLVISYVGFVFGAIKLKFLPIEYKKSKETLEKWKEVQKDNISMKTDLVESDNSILDVKDLYTYFYTEEGVVRAVEGVSYTINKNEVVGLVGETGCGKSVTALSILQLVRSPGKIIKGEIFFKGEDLLRKSEKEIANYRGNKITMIFQDPLNSINPVYTIGFQISEVFYLHQRELLLTEVEKHAKSLQKIKTRIKKNPSDEQLKMRLAELKHYSSIFSLARKKSQEILKSVGIPDPELILNRYPHELSGGMRQRVMIAMALVCKPELLIADEPTTALDVTIQNQILKLMKDLRQQYETSILFITHDLGIISKMCDKVAVMYSGKIVEYGTVQKILLNPSHPYTKNLIAAIPRVEDVKKMLEVIPGTVPNLIYPPEGCRFHPRCQSCFEPCNKEVPQQIELASSHFVACHLYDERFLKKQQDLGGKME